MDRRAFSKSMIGAGIILQHMPEKTKLAYLKPGDRVGLICPAGPIDAERLEKAKTNMSSLGLQPVTGDHILDQTGYLAGGDQARLADLHRMYHDKDINAVWCIRGGYGCTRLLPYLDLALIKSNPKLLIGYSDLTALHLALYLKAGHHNLHGPVASSDFTEYTLDYLRQVLFGSSGQNILISPSPANDQLSSEGNTAYDRYIIYPGEAQGRLWGGNLSLLSAMSGTDYLKIREDIILFIEDIEEAPYRIDRMLTQLFQVLPMTRVKGIVVGVCAGCEKKPDTNSFSLKEVMIDRIQGLNIPAIYGFSFGHILNQCTLPIGAKTILNTHDFSLTVKLP